MQAIERLTAPVHAVGESPVWRAAERALYWVDIPARRIHRLQPDTGATRSWTAPQMVACMAFARDGSLVAGMETGIFSLQLRDDGTVDAKALAEPELPLPGMRFIDGRCDRQGRFWAGTMHMDMPGAYAVGGLYRYAAGRGLTGPVQRGLITQNGLAWSPSG